MECYLSKLPRDWEGDSVSKSLQCLSVQEVSLEQNDKMFGAEWRDDLSRQPALSLEKTVLTNFLAFDIWKTKAPEA